MFIDCAPAELRTPLGVQCFESFTARIRGTREFRMITNQTDMALR